MSDIFGGFARGGGPFAESAASPRPQSGSDVTASVAVTLEQLARREKVRVELPTGKTLELSVPPGTKPGQTIRLRGQGLPRMGGAGDALVSVEFVPHPKFKLDGDALRLDLPLTIDEAVLGAKVRVPTLEGAVALTIVPGSNAGRTLRLKGKGLPNATGGNGDLLVTIRIVLPEEADKELEEFLREWRKTHAYSVRADDFEN